MSTPTPPLTDVATPMEVDVAPTKESAPPPTKPTQVLPKTAGPKTYSKTTSAGLDSVICYTELFPSPNAAPPPTYEAHMELGMTPIIVNTAVLAGLRALQQRPDEGAPGRWRLQQRSDDGASPSAAPPATLAPPSPPNFNAPPSPPNFNAPPPPPNFNAPPPPPNFNAPSPPPNFNAPSPPPNFNAPSPPPNFNAPPSLDTMEIMTEAGPLSSPLGKQASPAVSPTPVSLTPVSPTPVSLTPAAAKKNMPPPLDLPPPMVVREKKREHGALSDLGEDTKRKKVHFKVDERSPSGSPLPAPKTKAEETGGYPHRNPSPCSDDENWRVLYHDGYQTF
jgi:hypothetical protein